MNQIVLVGLITLTCISIFFIYQNIKLKRMYTDEFSRINKNMDDMTKLISLSAEKGSMLNSIPVQTPNTAVAYTEQESPNNKKYEDLQNNYEEYVKTNFDNFDYNIPEDIKEGIENLVQTNEGYSEVQMNDIEDIENTNLESQNNDSNFTENSFVLQEQILTTETPQENFEEPVVQEEHVEGEPVVQEEHFEGDQFEVVHEDHSEGDQFEVVHEDHFEEEQVQEEPFVEEQVVQEEHFVGEQVVQEENFVEEQVQEDIVLQSTDQNFNDNEIDFDDTNSVVDQALSESGVLENFGASANNIELENMTLKELQKCARDNNVKIKGKKTELIDRLKEKLLTN